MLVLDDYHLVTSAQVHTSVATLLGHSPPQLHLMLITRADPPLPLSRARVRGDLAELRAEDLRFSAGEALEFFGDRLETQLLGAGRAQAAGADSRDGPQACNWRPCGCAAGLTHRPSSSVSPARTGTSSTISATRC